MTTKPTEQELIMKFSAAIKRASGGARALLHHQRNFSFNVLVDTLDLLHTMALSQAAETAANDVIMSAIKEKR